MCKEEALCLDGGSGVDYKLKDGQENVWITVNNISVSIRRTDEGVAVDLYAKGVESLDEAQLGSTWGLFDEATTAIDDHGKDREPQTAESK